MNNKFYCGIDVSKKKLDVMLLVQEKYHYKVVENSNDGVIFLQEWIKSKLEKDAFVHFCMEATNVYHELLAFSLLENKNFKVGIISDTQLPPTEEALKESDLFVKHLKDALTTMKNNNVDMIMFPGDIGDLGTYFAFELYQSTIDEVYGEDRPIIQTVMGNHDYWNKNASTAINHIKAFKEVMNESPWTHYVVNGYHFIGASPNNGSMSAGYKVTSKWLEKELEKASADSQGKPIFVMTHNQPKDTCYGSDEWGDSSLNDVLSKCSSFRWTFSLFGSRRANNMAGRLHCYSNTVSFLH